MLIKKNVKTYTGQLFLKDKKNKPTLLLIYFLPNS